MTSLWRLERLPFVYGHLPTPSNGGGLPDSFPFELGLDERAGRVCQIPTDGLQAILGRAYAAGSQISGQMDGTGIGRQYADDLLGELLASLGGGPLNGLRILEIGCGTGYLLSRLRDHGATVLGIEPGTHCSLTGQPFPVEIIRGFFPNPALKGPFDLILTSMVLEHMEDPVGFLGSMRSFLAPGGRVWTTVPNAEAFIDQGDISMLFHEHFSYFTAGSLHNTLVQAGLGDVVVTRSKLTQVLHSVACSRSTGGALLDVEDGRAAARRYRQQAEQMIASLRAFLIERARIGTGVGIYVPGRFVNLTSCLEVDYAALRFFDDNPALHGTYFPGIPIRVENFQELQQRPPGSVLIMSLSFGGRIRDKVRASLGQQVEITTLGELSGSLAGRAGLDVPGTRTMGAAP